MGGAGHARGDGGRVLPSAQPDRPPDAPSQPAGRRTGPQGDASRIPIAVLVLRMRPQAWILIGLISATGAFGALGVTGAVGAPRSTPPASAALGGSLRGRVEVR